MFRQQRFDVEMPFNLTVIADLTKLLETFYYKFIIHMFMYPTNACQWMYREARLHLIYISSAKYNFRTILVSIATSLSWQRREQDSSALMAMHAL